MTMGLLAPGFLLGALAIGLPVYLHLLRRHSANRVLARGTRVNVRVATGRFVKFQQAAVAAICYRRE